MRIEKGASLPPGDEALKKRNITSPWPHTAALIVALLDLVEGVPYVIIVAGGLMA